MPRYLSVRTKRSIYTKGKTVIFYYSFYKHCVKYNRVLKEDSPRDKQSDRYTPKRKRQNVDYSFYKRCATDNKVVLADCPRQDKAIKTHERESQLFKTDRVQGRSQTSDNRGNCEALKARASRRSKMPFFTFSWWYFPPKHNQNPTKFNIIYVCYVFFSLKFERFYSEMKFWKL